MGAACGPLAHLREEGGLLFGTIDLPETRTPFRDRHVLIVVRGTDDVRDLRALRAYIEDVNPILVGVEVLPTRSSAADLSVYGEFRSISSAIERVPLLERLDSFGRAS